MAEKRGLETWEQLKANIEAALDEGGKFYEGNKTAGRRARKALDRVAKLKVKWRKETA